MNGKFTVILNFLYVVMKTLYTFIISILLFGGSYSIAAIRYVKPMATGAGDGSSWANASANLQAMINASSAGDELWVAAGKYFPTSYPGGCTTCGAVSSNNRNNTFLLKSGVRVYGGFTGNETARALRNSHLNETILSGNIGAEFSPNDNAYHVVTAIDCSVATHLERFTIEGGNANVSSGVTVGGRTYYRSWGGGVLCVYSPISIVLCAIVGNNAIDGGGILNTASNTGILNSVIALNTASAGGGGIYNHEGSESDTRWSTIAQNTATVAGGAMYNYNSNPYLIDVIVWDNVSPSFAGVANNGSRLTGYTSIVQGGWGLPDFPCSDCINVEPQFMNKDFPAGIDGRWGSRDDGLRVSACSPGLDKGRGGAISADMANQSRNVDIPAIPNHIPSASGLDIGAYEYQNTGASNQVLHVNGSLATGLNDGSSWANAFRGANAFGNSLRHANHCDNNTILVSKGTYKPHRLPFGVASGLNQDFTFELKGGLTIYGGFDGAGTVSDYSSRKARENETIFSGDFSDNDVVTGSGGTLAITNNSENANTVVTAKNGIQATLKGLTIKGGQNRGIDSYAFPLEIDDCIIKHNRGGVYLLYSSSLFLNNVFDRNLATNGGGIYAAASGIVVKNSVFTGNRASTGKGGAIRNELYFSEFYNNTFYNNSAQLSGGALYTEDPGIADAPIDINRSYNNIFYKNAISTNTSTIYADFFIERNGRDFKNNILQFASAQYPLNNTPNGIGTTSSGNLFAVNPLFANENNLLGLDGIGGTADDGLRLQKTSPAINAGTYSYSPSNDILSNFRYLAYDMGAYEFHPKEACPDIRYIADVPIEAGIHYAGTSGSFVAGPAQPTKNQRIGAAMAIGDGYITAIGTVASSTSVVFDASKSITLLPGFQAQSGSVFRTNLQGCSFFEGVNHSVHQVVISK